MADNPKAALDAVLEDEKEVGGLKIWPLTLGRYALLELAESPFTKQGAKLDTASLIPTFWIMTRSPAELKGWTSKNIDKLAETAMEWAETAELSCGARLVEELMEKFGLVGKVKPESKEEDSKKNPPPPTAGSLT